MTTLRSSVRAVALAGAALLAVGCQRDSDLATSETGAFALEINNVVGNQALVLDATRYATAAGDDFAVSTFKYYVSNVELRRADNSVYSVPDSYFLVDQARPESRLLRVQDVPAGDYTGLSFVVGVDSARTKAGNLTGVLNADRGMFWDWTQEFINVKLEGTSRQSPRGGLVFHVAGFKGGNGANNTIRTVSLPFPRGSKLSVGLGGTPKVHVRANVLAMFGAPNSVRFAEVNTVHHGPWLTKIADNIAAGMFAVDQIEAN